MRWCASVQVLQPDILRPPQAPTIQGPHVASISDKPIDPVYIHEHVCIQCVDLLVYIIVLENIHQKHYPNSNVKLLYQYRIKLEMSIIVVVKVQEQ